MSSLAVFARARVSRARLSLLATMLCTTWAPSGLAAGAEVQLTLRDAIQAALDHNPDLALFQFQFRAIDGERQQAGLRPAPEMEFSVENFGGTGEAKLLKGAEATLSLSRVIELGGKRDARLSAVDAGRDSLTVAKQAAQLDVVAEVTRRYIAVAEGQEKVRLAERATELAADTARATDERVQAAVAPHVELDRARVAEQRAQLELLGARSTLASARQLLAAMWGSDNGTLNDQPVGDVQGRLSSLPAVADFEALVSRLSASPDFLRFASEERLRDAEVRLAMTQRRADLTVGGGIRRLQSGGDFGLVAGVSIPLFAGKRADGAIAAAAARRDAVGAERDAALARARADLFGLHRQLQDAVAIVRSLETSTIPTMEEALTETQYAFERGRYSYLELVDAQREYLAVQSERIDASALAQLLATEIERLTNAPLAP